MFFVFGPSGQMYRGGPENLSQISPVRRVQRPQALRTRGADVPPFSVQTPPPPPEPAKPGILGRLFGTEANAEPRRELDDAMLEDLEEMLIQSDMGVETALRVTANIAEGRMGRRMPSKPRAEPFRLAGAGGHSWPAFLWKDLVAMGPLYRLRIWLLACVAATAYLSHRLSNSPITVRLLV